MLRIQQINLSLDEDLSAIQKKITKKLHITENELISYHIFKESIDARKKDQIHFTYCVDCKVKNEKNVFRRKIKDVTIAPKMFYVPPVKGIVELKHRPIVVGFGPAGMFASLLLAQMGYSPIVLERGQHVDDRVKSVEEFWTKGTLNTTSNVQFGEGGAGTFSDGKLTTRVKDLRIRKILEELVRFGAPEEIMYQAHPHIGTDLLRDIVKKLREEIENLGGEIRFQSTVEDILIEENRMAGVVVNGEVLTTNHVVLAIGHSARDTMRMLHKKGIAMSAKGFAIGARIEHPQSLINTAQFKEFAGHPRLGAAEYRLVHSASNGRGVYTFCMCPGGTVVASASMEGGVVVNGMSEQARDQENANSAILVQIRTSDFQDDPMLGIAYQEEIERKAFVAGGSNYQAPAQLVKDFLSNQASSSIGSVTPTYNLGVTMSNLDTILPEYVTSAMKEGIEAFDKKIKGFALDDAILTGVETRSSSPLRMERNTETLMSLTCKGLYPCGEGAGYAGGIVSSAIDGLRCAEKIIELYCVSEKE